MDEEPMQLTPSSARAASEWGVGGVLAVVNAVLVGIGGVYLATESVTVTIVASLAAVILATLVLLLRHR